MSAASRRRFQSRQRRLTRWLMREEARGGVDDRPDWLPPVPDDSETRYHGRTLRTPFKNSARHWEWRSRARRRKEAAEYAAAYPEQTMRHAAARRNAAAEAGRATH